MFPNSGPFSISPLPLGSLFPVTSVDAAAKERLDETSKSPESRDGDLAICLLGRDPADETSSSDHLFLSAPTPHPRPHIDHFPS